MRRFLFFVLGWLLSVSAVGAIDLSSAYAIRLQCLAYANGGTLGGVANNVYGNEGAEYDLSYLPRVGYDQRVVWSLITSDEDEGKYVLYNRVYGESYDKSYYVMKHDASANGGVKLDNYLSFGTDCVWQFVHLGNNVYAIRNVLSGLYLSVKQLEGDECQTLLREVVDGEFSDNERFHVYNAYSDALLGENYMLDFSITINGRKPVIEKNGKRAFLTVDEDMERDGEVDLEISYSSESVTLQGIVNGGTSRVQLSNGELELIVLHDGEEVGYLTIVFSTLPFVEVNTVYSGVYSEYEPASICVHEADVTDTVYSCRIKTRGATATRYSKKSYAIKLRKTDEDGYDAGKENASFMGMRSDNKWILDAAAVDPSRMRNRVSTDLWNDFSAKPHYYNKEPGMVNGTRGHFVELLLNGEYRGLYCMTEKIDRKQLQLKKYIEPEDSAECEKRVRGVLYKSEAWTYTTFMGHQPDNATWTPSYVFDKPDNHSATWDPTSYGQYGWEHSYPDMEDGQDLDWNPLYRAVKHVAKGGRARYMMHIGHFFDMPVMTDYYLFVELMLATDNHGKNWFLSARNVQKPESGDTCRLLITPWDLDGTWGRRWDGSSSITRAELDFDTFLRNNEHGEHGIFHYLKEFDSGTHWTDTLKRRYAVLRRGAFDADSLKGRFERYAQLYESSGAYGRELQQWGNEYSGACASDIDVEIDYICTWIDKRLAVLDKKYGYDPTAEDGIDELLRREWFSVTGADGCIWVNSNAERSIAIYSLDGHLLRREPLHEGMNRIAIAPGMYVAGGKKVVVR